MAKKLKITLAGFGEILMNKSKEDFAREYDREIFRSSVFSTLWAAFTHRKKGGLNLSALAVNLGKDKGYISRMFSAQDNCKLNTIADVIKALDMDYAFELIDRHTGERFNEGGVTMAPNRRPRQIRTVYEEIDDCGDSLTAKVRQR